MEDLNKIKERIARLLAMAGDDSSPNEAAIAARRARALMDKYQIDEFEAGQIRSEFGESYDVDGAVVFMPVWKQSLAIRVAALNDCQAAFGGTLTKKGQPGKVIKFQGYEEDAKLALDMFNRFCDKITKECSAYMKAQGYTRYVASIGDAFKANASSALSGRIADITDERRAQYRSQGTEVMIVKSANVADHFGAAKYAKKPVRRSVDEETARASWAGTTTGKKIEIHAGVE